MINDPTVLVECDGGCGENLTLSLTPLARGSWDDRYVNSRLEIEGWIIVDDYVYCPECKK